jgi:alanyl-tRNA synthetase
MGLLHEDGSVTETLPSGARGFVVLDRTPFYVEAGGQVSDTGDLAWPGGGTAEVDGVLRASIRPRLHHVVISGGTLRTGEDVRASIDTNRRDAIRRNHTATHLLHAALRQRFGTHVRQAGSLVSPDRLRFDFAHFQALSETDRREIERTVNAQIYQDTPVETAIKKTEDAIQSGAMALFGEKYGDTVRVVSVGDFSVELCGGTHVGAVGEIGPFILTEESGVAAGVRRIEAITGDAAVAHIQSQAAIIGATAAALGVPADHIGAAAAKLQTEVKRLARENTQLKMKLAIGREDAPEDDVLTIGDARFVARRVTGLDKDALRALSDSIRDRLKRGVVVLAAESDGRVQLLVSVTKELTDRIKAGQLVKSLAPLIGGGGGGRPDFAEAGGKDASGIDALLAEARVLVTRALQ